MYIDKQGRESWTRATGTLKNYLTLIGDCYTELCSVDGSALPFWGSVVISPVGFPIAIKESYNRESEFYLQRI